MKASVDFPLFVSHDAVLADLWCIFFAEDNEPRIFFLRSLKLSTLLGGSSSNHSRADPRRVALNMRENTLVDHEDACDGDPNLEKTLLDWAEEAELVGKSCGISSSQLTVLQTDPSALGVSSTTGIMFLGCSCVLCLTDGAT
uniref:Uncharacterized protein n=1 Tax=Tanacetum cinerariifolium TaxID=118510 RepID=A0A6L2K8V2_TANCI|nr:hypothetical protein [Tanacetum cinerariifolium]